MTTTVTVDISPTNKAPTVTKTVGTPNTTTGIVTGAVKGTDGDKDVVTLRADGGAHEGHRDTLGRRARTPTPRRPRRATPR